MESEEYIISPEAMYDSTVKCKKGKLYKSQVAKFSGYTGSKNAGNYQTS